MYLMSTINNIAVVR